MLHELTPLKFPFRDLKSQVETLGSADRGVASSSHSNQPIYELYAKTETAKFAHLSKVQCVCVSRVCIHVHVYTSVHVHTKTHSTVTVQQVLCYGAKIWVRFLKECNYVWLVCPNQSWIIMDRAYISWIFFLGCAARAPG